MIFKVSPVLVVLVITYSLVNKKCTANPSHVLIQRSIQLKLKEFDSKKTA